MKRIIEIPDRVLETYKYWEEQGVATVEQTLIAHSQPYDEPAVINIKPLTAEEKQGLIDAFKKSGLKAVKLDDGRNRGEWKRITNESANVQMFLCSECGRKVEVGYSQLSPSIYYPFCHCGADMRGGEDK